MTNWKGIFGGASLAAVETIEIYVDDVFGIEVSVIDSGQVNFRNVACGLVWPVGVIAPRTNTDGTLIYTDGTLFTGLSTDLIVKQLGDEIGISKSIKSGVSISQVGSIATVQFVALAEGEGEIALVKLEANDIENGQVVSRYTASDGSVIVNASPVIQPTKTVIFKVRVVK